MTPHRRDERGASLVELALVLPLLAFVLLAALSTLWMLAARSALTGAARDGARHASIRVDPLDCDLHCDTEYPTDDAIVEIVTARVGSFGPVSVEVEPGGPARVPNSPITVRVRRDLPVLFEPVGALLGWDGLSFRSEAKVRAE